MAANSSADICNMAVSSLGNYGTINDIDTPTNDKERACAIWYDVCRQFVLKMLMPNFALARELVAQLSETPAFGFAYAYEYPSYALKVLGVGNIEDKENNYVIETISTGAQAIFHDTDYDEGMELRFIRDITDISRWSPEAKILFSQYLAAYTCLPITQDVAKANKLMAALPAQISSASSLNAQENRPIRISNSRFKASRFADNPNYESKK